jgi:hypothetical protein
MGERHLDVVDEGTRTIRGVVRQLKWGTTREGNRPFVSVELETGGPERWVNCFDERLLPSFCIHVMGREVGLTVKPLPSKKRGGGTYLKVVDGGRPARSCGPTRRSRASRRRQRPSMTSPSATGMLLGEPDLCMARAEP